MKKLVLFIFSLALLFYGCKQSTEPTPPLVQNPPGYQEDVPWPGLADSPWPSTIANSQRTCRSKSLGGTQGIREVINLPQFNQTGLAIGKDSTIYYTAVYSGGSQDYSDTSGLVALTPSGKIKWIFPFKANHGKPDPASPIVRNDGVIYVSSNEEKKLYAINPDGTLLWELDDMPAYDWMVLGKDGTLYCSSHYMGGSGFLNAISSEGKILWQIPWSQLPIGLTIFAITPDNKSLILSSDYKVKSLNLETREIEWESQDSAFIYSIMIDSQGEIYSLEYQNEKSKYGIFKYDRNGKIIWRYLIPEWEWGAIALNEYGDCIAAIGDTLYSIDYNGKLKWKTALPTKINGLLSLDSENNIYFAASDLYLSKTTTYLCYDSNGNLKWETSGNDNFAYGFEFPCIPAYGRTYFLSYFNNKLVIIK